MRPEDVHPTHDVREEGVLVSDPTCQKCRMSVFENEQALREPCSAPCPSCGALPCDWVNNPHTPPASQSDEAKPTHYCVNCAARWIKWPDGTWSTRSPCGPCCDNVPMDQAPLIAFDANGDLSSEEHNRVRRAFRRRMLGKDEQPVSQSDEALVEEIAKAIYDATHAGLSNCYTWEDAWEQHQEPQRKRYYREARAILPIITAREASARAEGRREGIEEAAKVETGWLIEHADEPKWLNLSTAEAVGGLDWTKDSNAAARFARREDAEAYVWAHFGGDGPIRITEHRWG